MSIALLNLLQLSDPALPIGGYSHSSGLETYVQKGLVNNVTTAKDFITEMLVQNIQYTDAAFVSLAYDAAATNNTGSLMALDEQCNAVKLASEVRQASQKLAVRLIKIFTPVVQNQITLQYASAIQQKQAFGHYCISFGLYAHALGIKKEEALNGYYYNTASGFVTNCVKLVPLGQQDGQQILFGLQNTIAELAKKSMEPDLSLLGLCCTGFDMRCMQHEQLYSRLYMS